jgi:hypothetical protein
MKKSEFFLNRENEILKRLLADGYFWVNYSSTDCDGCSSEYPIKMTSLEELYTEEENKAEWADGPFSFSLAEKNEHGEWDLVEMYRGGSW